MAPKKRQKIAKCSSSETEVKSDFDRFLSHIIEKRAKKTDPATSHFRFSSCRVRLLGGKNCIPDYGVEEYAVEKSPVTESSNPNESVMYWMNRDQRIQDNWALLFAQRVALKFQYSLGVCFNISTSSALLTRRHFAFQMDGLKEVAEECGRLNIHFHFLPLLNAAHNNQEGLPNKRPIINLSNWDPVVDIVKNFGVKVLITDFSPLRSDVAAVEYVLSKLDKNIPLFQVDAHNVVPAWVASDKLEYAARTIRRKLHEKASYLLSEFPSVIKHPYSQVPDQQCLPMSLDWNKIASSVIGYVDESVHPITWANGGALSGLRTLHEFIEHRLTKYASIRNDPTQDAVSNLSPWLHFGHISAQRCILEVTSCRKIHAGSVEAFVEEAFIRRELSDNFCLYNPSYDSLRGAATWAQETLQRHAADKRDPAYSEEEMDKGRTADDLWNAAQLQLVRDGKMHGFLRMYWAKKILEWHKDGPEKALEFAIHLNDYYSIDGSDPNGFVGVMWSICGVHDQGWSERLIFGKIRYMNYAGCKRKFDIPAFVARYSS